MNIYSLLDESDDEKPKSTTENKTKPKDAASKNTASKTVTKKPAEKTKEIVGSNTKPTKTPTDKPKLPSNGASSAPAETVDESEKGKDNNRGGRPRGKDPHKRGGRGGGGVDAAGGADDSHRRPKREFERRSGTGRGREVSKGGRGAFGAGNVAQDAQEAEKDPNAAVVAVDIVDGEVAAEETEPVEETEPEPETFTLDEFMEKRNEARKKALELMGDAKPVRSVNKDADFAGLKSVEESELENYIPAKNTKASIAENARKDQRSTGKNKIVDVGFKFEVQNNDRDDRGYGGGRGGGRGRGGGGRGGDRGRGSGDRGRGSGGRGGRGSKPVTVFNSVTDFPSL